MSFFDNATSMGDLVIAANNVSGGYYVVAIVVTLWVVLFGITYQYGRSKAITYSSFITGMALLFLNLLGLAPFWWITADGVLFMFGLFMMQQAKQNQV